MGLQGQYLRRTTSVTSRVAGAISVGIIVLVFGATSLSHLIIEGKASSFQSWGRILVVDVPMTAGTLLGMGLYRGFKDLHRPLIEVVITVEISLLLGVLGAMATMYLSGHAHHFPRSVLLLGAAFLAFLLPAYESIFVMSAKKRFYARPTITVTQQPILTQYRSSPLGPWGIRVPKYIRLMDVIHPLQWEELEYDDRIILIGPDVDGSIREKIVTRGASAVNCDILVIPRPYEVLLLASEPEQIGDMTITRIQKTYGGFTLGMTKRSADLIVASAVILMLSPLMAVVALMIWLEDRGTVFYSQTRVGLRGRLFRIIKFRTMVPDAEVWTGPVLAHVGDPRITRVGRFLRTSRLDELPQLLNVVKGEMSLVGPRPERPDFVEPLERENPFFAMRTQARPGITGLAQVLGRYDSHPDDKLRFDLRYISRYSLWLDIEVLIRTLLLLFSRKGPDRALWAPHETVELRAQDSSSADEGRAR